LVKKWGNSASVRIPTAIMQAARLKLDQPVDMREEDGKVVIEPVRSVEYRLAELVGGITQENLHKPVEFGPPAGKEVW